MLNDICSCSGSYLTIFDVTWMFQLKTDIFTCLHLCAYNAVFNPF